MSEILICGGNSYVEVIVQEREREEGFYSAGLIAVQKFFGFDAGF